MRLRCQPAAIALGAAMTAQVYAGDLPDPQITPGLADPNLTKEVLCAPGFTTRSIRRVPSARKKAIYYAYRMAPDQPPCPCEVDHLIPLELGGSNRPRNLWPEPVAGTTWNSRVKDRLERRLHDEVCSGVTDLETAQNEIATDWIAAYTKRFGHQQ